MGAIEKQEQAIVTPVDADAVLEMIQAFEYFKSKVLNKKDFAVIKGEPRVKKSGWSKYALACNVSTELRDERVEERDGHRIYHFTYRAVHLPSGRFADAVGSASEAEKKEWTHPEHDVRSLAQTRAFNRSISNLVGGGEVSAEEIESATQAEPKRYVESQQAPKEPRRPVTEGHPQRRTRFQLGRVNLGVIAYNLKALGFGEDDVGVFEEEDAYVVEPVRDLREVEHYKISGTLEPMGAVWEEVGYRGRWRITKEVDG